MGAAKFLVENPLKHVLIFMFFHFQNQNLDF